MRTLLTDVKPLPAADCPKCGKPAIERSDMAEMIERFATMLQRATTSDCREERCFDEDCPKRSLIVAARRLARVTA